MRLSKQESTQGKTGVVESSLRLRTQDRDVSNLRVYVRSRQLGSTGASLHVTKGSTGAPLHVTKGSTGASLHVTKGSTGASLHVHIRTPITRKASLLHVHVRLLYT